MKKTVKSAISIVLLLVLSLSLFACGNSLSSKTTDFLETFYSDKYNLTRNEIVKSLWGTALDAKMQVTGFYSGKLLDGYEDTIEKHVNKECPETVSTTASKIQTYAETKDISFTIDEAKKVAISLIIHLVENYDYYY